MASVRVSVLFSHCLLIPSLAYISTSYIIFVQLLADCLRVCVLVCTTPIIVFIRYFMELRARQWLHVKAILRWTRSDPIDRIRHKPLDSYAAYQTPSHYSSTQCAEPQTVRDFRKFRNDEHIIFNRIRNRWSSQQYLITSLRSQIVPVGQKTQANCY